MQEHKAKVVVTLSTSVNNNAHNLITFWLYAKELLTTSDKLSKKTIFLLCLSEETNPAYNYSRTQQFIWLPNTALMSSDFYTTRMVTLRILYEQSSTLMLLFPKHNAPEASLNREKLSKSAKARWRDLCRGQTWEEALWTQSATYTGLPVRLVWTCCWKSGYLEAR